jgi:putative ubiquitin-RnfH superfamily antitoxin RatB of RatAB toxin-antitoxin module
MVLLRHSVTVQRLYTVMIDQTIVIEVVFAVPEKQQVIQLEVPSGTVIHDVVRLSCIESHFPGYDLSMLPVGVWNQVKPRDYVVQSGDRVQIYRSLITNAKDARRQRAETQARKETQANKEIQAKLEAQAKKQRDI